MSGKNFLDVVGLL